VNVPRALLKDLLTDWKEIAVIGSLAFYDLGCLLP